MPRLLPGKHRPGFLDRNTPFPALPPLRDTLGRRVHLPGGAPAFLWGWAGVRRRYSSTPNCVSTNAYSSASSRRRSEEHTSELQSLMRISYAVFCLKKKKKTTRIPVHKRKHTTNALRQVSRYNKIHKHRQYILHYHTKS